MTDEAHSAESIQLHLQQAIAQMDEQGDYLAAAYASMALNLVTLPETRKSGDAYGSWPIRQRPPDSDISI